MADRAHVLSAASRIKPTLNKILAYRAEPAEQSRSGLWIPESARWRGDTAEILALGPGVRTKDLQGRRIFDDLAVGDIVALPEYAGVEVRIDGVLFALITEDDILAVLPRVESVA